MLQSFKLLTPIFGSSSPVQCFEDIYIDEKPRLKLVLYYLNIIFCAIFVAEMLLKWFSLGFRKYFSGMWTVLDFCIVVVSLAPHGGRGVYVLDVSFVRIVVCFNGRH